MKVLLTILTITISSNLFAQELTREVAFRNKIKQVRVISSTEMIDTVNYNYDINGLLISINQKPSPYIYLSNALRITSYYYEDTLLKMKLIKTFIGDTLFKTDSVLYNYNEYKRLVSTYSNYVDNIPTLELNIYSDPKQNLNQSLLIRTENYKAHKDRFDTLNARAVTDYKKVFYLQDFKVFANSNINYYTKCLAEKTTNQQTFCKSKLERVVKMGDSLRQTFIITTGYNDLGFKNEILNNDSAYFYFGDHDISSVTTEKFLQGKVIEKNVFEYDDTYRSKCKSSNTSFYVYDNSGLISQINSKGIVYLNPNDKPINLESASKYEYVYYDK